MSGVRSEAFAIGIVGRNTMVRSNRLALTLSYVLALRQNADHVAGARDLQAGAIFRTAL